MDSPSVNQDASLGAGNAGSQQVAMTDSPPNNDTRPKDTIEDVDRCRICRGEGTKDEELFYPCKCNGSIKYVHQSCLVEWLSHSQKKHCELCKTPFRFTKLYDSNMPQSVPVLVFLRQAVVQAWKSFLTYARLHLVVFVWAFWLPWCMRAVWRGLFWVGDGGWVDWRKRSLEDAVISQAESGLQTPWSRAASSLTTAPEALASMVMSGFSNGLKRQGRLLTGALNADGDEPFTLRMMKSVYRFLVDKSTDPASTTSAAYPTATPQMATRAPSWLSDVAMLNSLTRSPTINNIIIDTVEGQIITMAIVLVFIILFLIREWVMQQQQNILVGPGPEQARNIRPDAPVQRQEHPAEPIRGHVEEAAGGDAAGIQQARILLQPRGRLQRRATHAEGQQLGIPDRDVTLITGNDALPTATLKAHASHPEPLERAGSHRPTMPARGTTGAVEIRRNLDNPFDEHEGAGVQTFKDLWSRAHQDPTRVLQIIEQEKRTEELDWIVKFMKKLEGTVDHGTSLHSHFNTQLEQDMPSIPVPSDGLLPGETSNPTSDDLQRPNRAEREQRLDSMLSSSVEPLFPPSSPADSPDTWHLRSPALIDMHVENDNGPISQSQSHPVLALPPPTAIEDLKELQRSEDNQDTLVDEPSTSGLPSGSHALAVEATSEAAPRPDVDRSAPKQSLLQRLMDFMWGETQTPDARDDASVEDEEHVVRDIAEEAPFVPAHHRQPLLLAPNADGNPAPAQDADVVAAAVQAGMDPNPEDPMDDIEDMEGVMELIGMQGPVLGLIQKGTFCALLVALTITAAVWIPYMVGKMSFIVLARPLYVLQQPLRFASTVADMIVDLCIFAAGCSYYWLDKLSDFLCSPVTWVFPSLGELLQNRLVAETAKEYAERALARLAHAPIVNSDLIAKGLDIPRFSIIAHECLQLLKARIATTSFFGYKQVVDGFQLAQYVLQDTTATDLFIAILGHLKSIASRTLRQASSLLYLASALLYINPLKINISSAPRAGPVDYSLAAWSSKDRSLAITCGYLFFTFLGLIYLRLAAAFKGTNKRGRVRGWLAELLYQAGGVIKVILIISIEMIVFPLYCGILLDVALLPLFAKASISTRLQFAMVSPNAAFFIHWFVGTCYMFHFALFVSMCRKILRSGVLFFIRDPDDPTFHPVRDVLERNVSTQLWKISFSAMVYGGLILACLGSIVWGLAAAPAGIFPIQWSSSEPVLEFPVDILFYNFLTPVALKYCKPANRLTKIYSWWFHKCGRWLRLSNFLFNEDHQDEKVRLLGRTWREWISRAKADPPSSDHVRDEAAERARDKHNLGFRMDGKWVQAPSSDQLRIPKGHPTFFEVDESNEPINMCSDSKLFLLQNSESFTKVYIPSWFRLRVAALIFLIWLFAAGTGISVTIVPLLLGRYILSRFIPGELRMNDIYALSLGAYLLGGALYASIKAYGMRTHIRSAIWTHTSIIQSLTYRAKAFFVRALGLVYTYSAFTMYLPGLVSVVTECYIIIPLYTYLSTQTALSEKTITASENSSLFSPLIPASASSVLSRPIVHLIQDWTLGILYVKVAGRLILWTTPSRPATALRNVVRNGWFRPDVWLATRGFFLPSTVLASVLLTFPLALGWISAHTVFFARASDDEVFRSWIYRYSYPAVLATAVAAGLVVLLAKAFGRWRRRVRDEVYLIGERLHNYGDSKRKKEVVDKGKGKESVERPDLESMHSA